MKFTLEFKMENGDFQFQESELSRILHDLSERTYDLVIVNRADINIYDLNGNIVGRATFER